MKIIGTVEYIIDLDNLSDGGGPYEPDLNTSPEDVLDDLDLDLSDYTSASSFRFQS